MKTLVQAVYEAVKKSYHGFPASANPKNTPRQVPVLKKKEPEYCKSCGGYGEHGYEEDSGKPYTCYRCGGTGYEKG